MSKPHFSVIIPVYNAAATLTATVRSVLAQSEADFELLLLDDGSSDAETLPLMLRLAMLDERIRAVAHANCGVAATRNAGAALARGQWLAFCDADDLWHPDKLARHRAVHAADARLAGSYARVAFIAADAGCADARATTPARSSSAIIPGILSLMDLMAENPVCTTSNLVVAKAVFEATGGFKVGMSFAEDQEWLIRTVAQHHALIGIDELLVDYRLSPAGLSVNLEGMYAGWRALADDHLADPALRDAAEALYCRYLARRALRAGSAPQQAWAYALRGLRLDRHAFLADRRRGLMTLASAACAPMLPRALRLRAFA